jgi:hypothetical protein
MGLENNSNAIYLTISNGKICRQLSAKTETSKERTNKNGKLVHEEFYDRISGMLTDIKVREVDIAGQQSKFWELKIEDEGKLYQLQFNYSSGYASCFLKSIPNADLTQRISFIPKMTEENGKKKTTLFVNQGGNALKHFYTKDNPNGLPQMTLTKLKGKDVWDDYDMMQFLEKMINEKIKPQLKGVTAAKAEPTMANAETDLDDDGKPMPF